MKNQFPSSMVLLNIILFVFISNETCSQVQETMVQNFQFTRAWEPNEQAASVLMPAGWQILGGVFRLEPYDAGEANAYLAKVDLDLRSDKDGTHMIHWCPSWIYLGNNGMSGGMMYGMEVFGPLTPEEYLAEVVFPAEHPDAQNGKILDSKKLERHLDIYRQKLGSLANQVGLDGDIITVEYEENGIKYREKMMTIIMYNQTMAGVIWANLDTKTIRAPANQFDQWEPVFDIIANSVELNPRWEANENALRNQIAAASMQNQQTYQYQGSGSGSGNELGDMIMDGWQKREVSSNSVYDSWNLNFNEFQNYTNPHTGDMEIGSNELDYRWINTQGDVYYSNDPGFDPNAELNATDFQLSSPGR